VAKRGVKKKEHERLDDKTLGLVVSLLEQEKPITKKEACERLNIRYDTRRLGNIIQEYKDKIEFAKRRRAANRGQPFTDLEIQEMVADYLNGESITKISESLFRSVGIVKKKLSELHLPERTRAPTYFKPDMIPEEAVSESFEVGELVWSARYNAVAEVVKLPSKLNAHQLFVFGKHNEFAYQPWWELGKLEIVKKHNIPVEKFIKTEKSPFNYRID